MIIAVDFDGTLCDDVFPLIGNPNIQLINALIEFRNADDSNRLILWTCRCATELYEAVCWCNSYGLFFDAINDNVVEHKRKYITECRKVFADYYIDDKMLSAYDVSEVLYDYK